MSPFLLLCMGLLALGLSGCAGYQAFREGQAQLSGGRVGPGLAKLREAMEQSPDSSEYRQRYFAERDAAVSALLRQAEVAMAAGAFDAARAAYASAFTLDAGNDRARLGSSRVDGAQRHWNALDASASLAQKGDLEGAVAKVQQVLSEDPSHARASALLKQLMRRQADRSGKELGIYPKLKAAYRVPVSLSFSNATLQQVFESLKQASGLNYVFDRDVRTDGRVTLAVTAKPVEDILRLLLATNQLERRVLDDDTLLIFPNTPAKAAEYKEMVVRTFYLTNTDATKMAALVRTIAKVKDVMVDEKLNLMVVRDTAEVVRLVEKIIAAQDLPEPEVMLELEVLEVSTDRLLEMGISWPSSLSAGVSGASGAAGQLTLDELRNFSSGSMVKLQVSDPLLAAQLRSTKGSANLLANPRVRVRNKQAAKIMIGERVPVFTTTAVANIGTSESVSYLDVGLKLEIEPTVSLDNDVSMKMALEVSNILAVVTRASGTSGYRLGTRSTSTTLRVHDGETNILAGLIEREERRSNTGIPGLNELPVASKLFGAAQDTDKRTEIVLLITPRIVRNIELPGVGLQEFQAGTEASLGAAPIQLGTPASAASNQGGSGRFPQPAASGGQPLGSPPQGSGAPGIPGTGQRSGGAPTAPAASPLAPAPGPAFPPGLVAPPIVPTPPGSLPGTGPAVNPASVPSGTN